jgi:hypothetical protein
VVGDRARRELVAAVDAAVRRDRVAELAQQVDVAAQRAQRDLQPGRQLGARPVPLPLQQRQQLQRSCAGAHEGDSALTLRSGSGTWAPYSRPRRPADERTSDDHHDDAAQLAQERLDLLETLQAHRAFLRFTVRDLTDEQARQRTTASALTLGGLVKHVTDDRGGVGRLPDRRRGRMGTDTQEYGADFRMEDSDTLARLLAAYEEVAARTDELVRALPDLDASHELPAAPWFPPGKHWSARRVLLHLVAETSQHAGHADILRETLDGQRTMG